jgi:hypothetical protein
MQSRAASPHRSTGLHIAANLRAASAAETEMKSDPVMKKPQPRRGAESDTLENSTSALVWRLSAYFRKLAKCLKSCFASMGLFLICVASSNFLNLCSPTQSFW